MLLKICGVMGVPTQSVWSEGMRLAAAISYKFPNVNVTPLSSLVRHASSDALGLPHPPHPPLPPFTKIPLNAPPTPPPPSPCQTS